MRNKVKMQKTTPLPQLAWKAETALTDGPWKDMLVSCAELQDSAILPPNNLFPDVWCEIGPGYAFASMTGHAFGHWDLIQIAMDALQYDPEYARLQLEHYFSLIYPDGMMPGSIYSKRRGDIDLIRPTTPLLYSHPPLWQEFVHDYFQKTGNVEFLKKAFVFGSKNFAWWQRERQAQEGGYYYLDVVKRWWESGIDKSVRWLNIDGKPHSCIDASCHICSVAGRLAEWAEILHEDPASFRTAADQTRDFINSELWDDRTGFFYDIEAVRGNRKKIMTFDAFWTIALNIADMEKQERLIKHLFDPKKFFTWHPVPSIALDQEDFSMEMWNGPSWNGIGYWIVRGCNRYGWKKEAGILSEKILSAMAECYKKYQTFFEFYNPIESSVEKLAYPHNDKQPCRNYLGHNPMNALYWEINDHSKQS